MGVESPADSEQQPLEGEGFTAPAGPLREAFGVTPHQLGEFTAGLGVDVGPRPNYPRYRREDVRRMNLVQALRELRVPLEAALRAGVVHGNPAEAGIGWLLVSPSAAGEWGATALRCGKEIGLWLRASADGRGCLLDLDTLARTADRIWVRARASAQG